jgi:hypothetical protein
MISVIPAQAGMTEIIGFIAVFMRKWNERKHNAR